MHKTWKKGEFLWLSPHFSSKEFDCQCKHPNCQDQRASTNLVENLEKLRIEYNAPIEITSGFRCKVHQAELLNEGYQACTRLSQHEIGEAGDLKGQDQVKLQTLAKKYFKATGISKHFLHIDTRADRVRIWYYK
jgi:uncharacterized protein YcbK (DUF882 family)